MLRKGNDCLVRITPCICARDDVWITNWIYLLFTCVPLVVEGCRKGNSNE